MACSLFSRKYASSRHVRIEARKALIPEGEIEVVASRAQLSWPTPAKAFVSSLPYISVQAFCIVHCETSELLSRN